MSIERVFPLESKRPKVFSAIIQDQEPCLKKLKHFGPAMVLEMIVIAACLFTPASFDRSGVVRTQVAEAFNQDGDEFVGPFASWANVKTQYGAMGNGAADDTKALQNALNDLGQSGKTSVMY